MVYHGWGIEELHLELHSVQVRGRCGPRIMIMPKVTVTLNAVSKNYYCTVKQHSNGKFPLKLCPESCLPNIIIIVGITKISTTLLTSSLPFCS